MPSCQPEHILLRNKTPGKQALGGPLMQVYTHSTIDAIIISSPQKSYFSGQRWESFSLHMNISGLEQKHYGG